MEPIVIDLNDLTEEKIQQAIAAQDKGCFYAGPCIIGTLIPEELRAIIDVVLSNSTLKNLYRNNIVSISDDQLNDAIHLQSAYDNKNFEAMLEIASKYVKEIT